MKSTDLTVLFFCMLLVQDLTGVDGFSYASLSIGQRTVHGSDIHTPPSLLTQSLQNKRSSYKNVAAAPNSNTDDDNDNDNPLSAIPKHRSLTLPSIVGTLYSMIGLGVVQAVRQNWLSAIEATIGCGLLWIGFVLAISFTEAWVKFRAPFLPRHYGLDVGRTVFPVLNAVEVAFCGTLWLVQGSTSTGLYNTNLLAAVSLILLSQVSYLTPQLVLMGKHIILEAYPEPKPTWSAKQAKIHEDISVAVSNKSKPSSKIHLIYVAAEFLKVVLLSKFVWNFRRAILVL